MPSELFRSSPRVRGFRCSVFRCFNGRLKQSFNYTGRDWAKSAEGPDLQGIVPRKLSRGRRGGEAEGGDGGVCERGADLANLLVRASGVHAIGEQDDEKLALRIDPN